MPVPDDFDGDPYADVSDAFNAWQTALKAYDLLAARHRQGDGVRRDDLAAALDALTEKHQAFVMSAKSLAPRGAREGHAHR